MRFVVQSLPLLVWLTVITVQVFTPPSEALSIVVSAAKLQKRGTPLNQHLDTVLEKRHDAEFDDFEVFARADLDSKPIQVPIEIKPDAIAKRWWSDTKTTYAASAPRPPKEAATKMLQKRAWSGLKPFLARVTHPPRLAIKKRWSTTLKNNWRFGGRDARAAAADMIEKRSEKRWTSNPRFNSAIVAVERPEKRLFDDIKPPALDRRGHQGSLEKVKRPKWHEFWTVDLIVNRPFVKRYGDARPLTDDELGKRYNVDRKPLRAIHL